MLKITHITPHLGGGVGRVLMNYFEAVRNGKARHRLICLEKVPETTRDQARRLDLPLNDDQGGNYPVLARAVEESDLVVVHWWNHPLLADCLWRGDWPPARVLLWSHVSGHLAPQVITPPLARFPDLFVAASPVTLKLAVFADRADPPRLLFSSGGVAHTAEITPRPHPGVRIGYLGTVDYAKMHPDFIDLSLAADLPEDAVFVVAGGPGHDDLKKEAARRGLSSRFEIPGPIDDLEDFFSRLDIFGYPLNPEHYGTGEQVLIEAQAAGVPPVVLAGGAEEFVVEHERTGLVAESLPAYSRHLNALYHQPDLRRRLSRAARRRAGERFGLEQTVAGWEALYREIMDRPKTKRPPRPAGAQTPWQLFLASQGSAAAFYENPRSYTGPPLTRTAFAATRGSVRHYAAFFPGDDHLRRLSGLIDQYRRPDED